MSLRTDLATDLVSRFPNAPSKALGRILYRENQVLFPTVDAAYQVVRQMRGAAGGRLRQAITPRCPRPPQKAGWKPSCPPSSAEPWLPYEIKGPARVLILADIHIPFHDLPAVKAAVSWGKQQHPTHLVLNGDVVDFYNVSRFEKNPAFRDLNAEVEAGKEFLVWLRQQFPRTKLVYKIGNHEERWDRFVWNKAPELWNLPQVRLDELLEFRQRRIVRVNDEPILAGMLPIFHGHELQKGAANPVNPARGAFLKAGASCLIAHLHRTSGHCEPDWEHTETATWSQGCLCELTPKYARVNKWNHGFAYVEVSKDGTYDVQNLRISKNLNIRSS